MAHGLAELEQVTVIREPIADGLIARPIGPIDLARVPAFHAQLVDVQNERPQRLVLDLSQVPEIDSATVATLVLLLRDVCRGPGMLVLCGLHPRVRSPFELVGLDKSVFTIVDTVDEAVAVPNRRKFGRFRPPRRLQCDRGEILDISAGGIRLRLSRRLKGLVHLRLWNDRMDFAVEARVVRRRRLGMRQYEAGLQFVNLGASAARKLAIVLGSLGDTVGRAPAQTAHAA